MSEPGCCGRAAAGLVPAEYPRAGGSRRSDGARCKCEVGHQVLESYPGFVLLNHLYELKITGLNGCPRQRETDRDPAEASLAPHKTRTMSLFTQFSLSTSMMA